MSKGGQLNQLTFDIWAELLKEDKWNYIIDVGANYGEMLLGAPLPGEALIIAFEPNPRIFPFLVKNLAKANIECDCRLQALSSSEGYSQLKINVEWSGLTRLLQDNEENAAGCEQQPVWTTTLSAVLSKISLDSRILIKIDVEGDEGKVLRGVGDIARFESFAALIEMLHLPQEDVSWILETFDVEAFELESGRLVKIHPPTFDRWEALKKLGRYYPNDVVLRRKRIIASG